MTDTAATTRFDLLDVGRVLWRRKGLILLAGLAGAVLAVLFSATVRKTYLAEGSVVVRAPALTSTDSDAAFGAGVVNEAVVTTEQDVLAAPGLLDRVADRIVIPPALLERPGPAERGSAWIRQASGLLGPDAQSWIDARLTELLPPQEQTPLHERRLQFVKSALTMAAGKNSSVINLRAITPDPQLSADMVNAILRIYLDDRAAEQNHTAELIQAALTERLRQTKAQIADREDQLSKLMNQPGIIDSSEVPGELRDVALVGQQLTQAQAELARRQAEYSSATQKGGRVFSAEDNTAMAEMRRLLAEQQANYARLSGTLGANHPNTQAAARQVASLQAQIAAESGRGLEQRRSDLAAAQATVNALQQRLDKLRQSRQAATPQTLDLDRQKEALASLWRISDILETRLIDMAARPANLNARILSWATVPTLAAFPSRGLYALGGFVLAAAAAMGATLVRAQIYRQRLVPIELAVRLNVPLLGGLPQISGRDTQRRLVTSALHDTRADVVGDTLSAVAVEVENIVRRGEMRCLMITSAKPGEGKTTVAIALGRSLAASGLRLLLVDLDLRRPSVERIFARSVRGTLADDTRALGGQVIDIRVDEASGIHLFTPPAALVDNDPIRMLRSKVLQDLIEQARAGYDLVLFDTPPVLALPDALIVAARMDAILLVTELGRAQEPEMEEFSRRLSRTGKPICGVIVTKVKTEDTYWEAY